MSSSLLIQAKRLELKKRHKKTDKGGHNSDSSVNSATTTSTGGDSSTIDSVPVQHDRHVKYD